MFNSPKSRAEQQFAAAQKQNKWVKKEKEKARQQQSDKMARLRDLRLEKEAAEKEAANAADSKTPPIAKHNGSKLKAKGADNEDAAVDLLEIPPNLRRQTNQQSDC